MKTFFLFFLLTTLPALACEVTLPYNLVVMGNLSSASHPFNVKNCETKVIDDLLSTVNGLEGRISATQLTRTMVSQGHEEINFEPHMIQVQNLKTLINEQLNLPPGVQVKSTQGVNMGSLLVLAPGDKVEIECSSCLFGSNQVINVNVSGFDGVKRSFLASVDFKKMVRAYRILNTTPSFADISSKDLKEEFTESIPHTDLVTDLGTLKFFKTNKPLKAGALLRLSDLNAVNLVRAGVKTDVVIENQMIRIKTQGISRSNGAIGEYVEVFHPQKNKKYQGKVVDVNKVLVEL